MREEIIRKMIRYYNGNKHDTAHFMKVWGYAHTIGSLEGLDEKTQDILETAAIVHDIACPYCRKKYGSANGKYQEMESEHLLREFLEEFSLEEDVRERVIYLVCHHHTYEGVDGMDWRILLEADYLVNADEGSQSSEAIMAFRENVFRTESGKQLLDAIYFPMKEVSL